MGLLVELCPREAQDAGDLDGGIRFRLSRAFLISDDAHQAEAAGLCQGCLGHSSTLPFGLNIHSAISFLIVIRLDILIISSIWIFVKCFFKKNIRLSVFRLDIIGYNETG